MERLIKNNTEKWVQDSPLKQYILYIVLWISDVLNTFTPPWFEIYLATELTKIDNLTTSAKLLQDEVLQEIRKILYWKLIRWIIREEWYTTSFYTAEKYLW